MDNNVYSNSSLNAVPMSGGSVRVTLSSGIGRGNAGVSLPCKRCLIVVDATASETVRVNVGSACTATTGIPIPEFGTNQFVFEIPIDDISKLYFYSADADAIIDIMYLR